MYELHVAKGSGWQGANWILCLDTPEHTNPGSGDCVFPASSRPLRSFETKEQAEAEKDRILSDLKIQESRELGV